MSEQPVGIVTGASGGIGTAVARKLSAKGYHLALMSRSGCREIAEELGALGVAGSVLDDNDVQNLVDQTMQRFGRIDGVVYGAGRHAQILREYDIPTPPPPTPESFVFDPEYKREIFDIPWQAWHDDFEMMVVGAMRLTKAVLPAMRAQGQGSIVAISGIEASEPRLPFPLGPIRLALHGFVKLVADRYGSDGVRMNCVVPGLMENAAADFHDGWERLVPVDRLGGVNELAETIAFLLSPGAGYITGQGITVDGGVNRGLGI